MKGITVTDKLNLKGGTKGATPFIQLISHKFDGKANRIDCHIKICESLAKCNDNDKRAKDLFDTGNVRKEQTAYIRDEVKKANNNINIKELVAKLAKEEKAIITLGFEIDNIESTLKEDEVDANLEKKKADLDKMMEAYKVTREELKNAKAKINDVLKINVDRAKKLISDSKKALVKLPSPEQIWTNQYPSFDSAKDLTEKEVYGLLKGQYTGAKEVA